MVSTSQDFADHRPDFIFLGGHAAVDFANTLIPPPGLDIDFLQSWSDVVDWLQEAKLSSADRLRLGKADGERALKDVHDLRNRWKKALDEIIAGRGVRPAFIEQLNAILATDVYHDTLHLERRSVHLHRSPSRLKGGELALGLLARLIADFLADAELKHVRYCANTHDCAITFYDTTKNHRRQWCSNAACGNRHKVAEFRKRQRKEQARS